MTKTTTILTPILLTTFSNLTYSQDNYALAFNRVTIATTVTDFLPTLQLNTANINIGTEIYLKNRKSLVFNLGLVKSYGPSRGWFSISSENTIGLKAQAESRHYLNKHKLFEPAILLFWPHIFQYKTQELENTGYYVAIHSSFQATATDRQETVFDYIDDTPIPGTYHYKQNIYTVDRNVVALNVKFGYQCIKKSGLTVDYAIGLGGQYISSSSTNRQGTDTNYPNSEKELGASYLTKGQSFIPTSFTKYDWDGACKKE
ncbi:hypothetical protein JYT51_01720 [Candidatus Amoebophilus asiaticus]|nr:hypothetical protein [Candidatus Amoebophilus asiaticus]